MHTLRSIMSVGVIAVHPDTPVREAIRLLIDNNISGLPVVDSERRITGVLSERDLLKVFYEEDCKTVGSLMTPEPITFSVDAPLVDVFDCLMSNDFRRVLVHEDGKLVGLVSRADLMPPLLEALYDRV